MQLVSDEDHSVHALSELGRLLAMGEALSLSADSHDPASHLHLERLHAPQGGEDALDAPLDGGVRGRIHRDRLRLPLDGLGACCASAGDGEQDERDQRQTESPTAEVPRGGGRLPGGPQPGERDEIHSPR
jgi:hypothetical protein